MPIEVAVSSKSNSLIQLIAYFGDLFLRREAKSQKFLLNCALISGTKELVFCFVEIPEYLSRDWHEVLFNFYAYEFELKFCV